jgi:hypothetical protein
MLGCNLLLNLRHFVPNIRLICDPKHCGDRNSCREAAPQGIVPPPRSGCNGQRRLNISRFRDQPAHDRRRRSATQVACSAARRCHRECRRYPWTASCQYRSAIHRHEDCHWRPIFWVDSRSPIGATQLLTCCSHIFGLFLISIGIRLVAFGFSRRGYLQSGSPVENRLLGAPRASASSRVFP